MALATFSTPLDEHDQLLVIEGRGDSFVVEIGYEEELGRKPHQYIIGITRFGALRVEPVNHAPIFLKR